MNNLVRPKIAIVARKGLGDGLINLVIANNLRINNYDVTLYNNFMAQLTNWISDICIKPWPLLDNCESEFAPYDLVLADDSSILGKPFQNKKDYPNLVKKYVYIGIGRSEPQLHTNNTVCLKDTLSKEKYEMLINLASCSGTIKHQHGNLNYSQVENAFIFCKEKLKLKNTTRNIKLIPPEHLGLKHKNHSKRVVIHPYSAYKRKNWPLKKYIKLADKLKNDGFEPVFICSSKERPGLIDKIKDSYPVPLLPTISDLASFIYESGLFIGNDSGPAHLASELNIPTVTIMFHKRNFYWRPDFSQPSVVILPPINIAIGPKSVWKWFVPVSKIYNETKKLVDK
jgi:hypothetical protein